jgi:hypothetical protein
MLLALHFFMHTLHMLWAIRSVQELPIVSLPTLMAPVPSGRVRRLEGGSLLRQPVLAKPFSVSDFLLSNRLLPPFLPLNKLIYNLTPPPHLSSRMRLHGVRQALPRHYPLWGSSFRLR